jgi:hypothetical protein
MKQLILFTVFLFGVCCCNMYGQLTTYDGVSLQAGSSFGSATLPFSVSPTTGSTAYEAQYQIVLGPDCLEYPACMTGNTFTGTTNTFQTSGFDNNSVNSGLNYFVARLVLPQVFNELKEKLDGDYFVSQQGKLYFKYIEKYTEGALDYQIYDYQRNQKVSSKVLTKTIGTNFYSIDLVALGGFTGGEYYSLEVLDGKGEKLMLRFKYIAN